MTVTTRRDVAKFVRQEFDLGRVTVYITRQKRPYTFVEVGYKGSWGYGFSKVRYPDTWDARTGLIVAQENALSDLTDNIYSAQYDTYNQTETSNMVAV